MGKFKAPYDSGVRLRHRTDIDQSGNPRARPRQLAGIDRSEPRSRGATPIDDIRVGGGSMVRPSAASGRVRRIDPL